MPIQEDKQKGQLKGLRFSFRWILRPILNSCSQLNQNISSHKAISIICVISVLFFKNHQLYIPNSSLYMHVSKHYILLINM